MEHERFVTRASTDPGIRLAPSEPKDFWVRKRHFGAQNETSLRLTRLRLVVLAFGLIIVVLSGALLQLTRTKMDGEEPLVVPGSELASKLASDPGLAHAVTIQPPATVEMLVAKQKIHAGTKLSDEMFTKRMVAVADAPEESIPANRQDEIVGMYSREIIGSDEPVLRSAVSKENEQAVLAFHIPPGYRAVSISVDSRSGVEGFAKPGTFVDVLWFYGREGGGKVTRIIPSAKILSVGGATQLEAPKSAINEQTNVTLLVTMRDAQIIELARNLGSLSLSLVSALETQEEGIPTAQSEPVTVRDIIRRARGTDDERMYVQGILETVDSFGRELKYVLSDYGWIEADSEAGPNSNAAADEMNIKKTWLAKDSSGSLPEYSRGLLIRQKKEKLPLQ